ncbi:lactonase family protein [Roseibacillus ishigakijimensis]|uniref:Lactonase family protein n=1 Tax=Roseibacillus ishigakijimensis TaxID=454146 RepID=A0A934RL34_9BACT|nr:lactonase family protein [Roseibacillus ishigakijimensis]MBK1833692.1 lactonase family protein [Roseibacillus ishigakijimensis]
MKNLLSLSLFLAISAQIASAQRVYLACGNAGVRYAEFDASTGTLSASKEGISLAGAGFLALHSEGTHLYSTYWKKDEEGHSGAVASLRIGEDGDLELVNSVSTKGSGACHVSLDDTSQVAFAANYGSGSVASFQVQEDGSLSEAVSSILHEGSSKHPQRQKGPHAHYFAVGPQNSFAYAPDLGLDQVVIYRFDPATAALSPAGEGKLAAGAGPRHMKFSRDGSYAYVLNELDLTVTTFRVDARDGSLTAIDTISTVELEDKEEMSCAEIRVHPNGRLVYTSQRDLRTREGEEIGRNSLSTFFVTDEGTLRRVQTISAGVRIPRNFNLDPSGRWLLAGGQSSEDIQIFSVAEDSGKLTPHGEPVACPGGPICFQFVPED